MITLILVHDSLRLHKLPEIRFQVARHVAEGRKPKGLSRADQVMYQAEEGLAAMLIPHGIWQQIKRLVELL
jgi:hypothetical protein